MMSLISKWETLRAKNQVGASMRISAEGLPQYCGISSAGNVSFFTITVLEPEKLPGLKVMSSLKAQLEDGSWYSGIVLEDEEFIAEFAYLCEDLVRAAQGETDEHSALAKQAAVYAGWLSFFQKSQDISAEEARGLFGELKFLQEQMDAGAGSTEVVASWQGPFGAPQDFIFDGFQAFEIKTLRPSADEVQITSPNQLSFNGDLTLKVYRLQNIVGKEFGETIQELVRGIERRLTPADLKTFRSKLSKSGFSETSSLCTEELYLLGGVLEFNANSDGFPKLTNAQVPLGVTKVSYKIMLSALAGFEVVSHEN